ncbi:MULTISPECIES: enoyl-CoA hydratase-related protein [Pacificibacter]|uniref:enoyl-CoA hydratase-related protein n=1 Tax=Pacificibacter TaxID=1042323 RepID=UPI001C087DD5|nr:MULTISPECIES: enoyl-CoA hydratase-related protein [Pacificibacter]MBU2936222.1 enoyl-CoA hydratase/isomerase family protein [Pacificibacter marinus]MDO6616785.1 enoyl-CoA hydratase-related protein [Pacificibacter sp. 1_MG-2023]
MTTSDAKSAAEQTQPPLVDTRHDGGVAYIVLCNPPMNALTLDVRRSLLSSLQIAQDDPNVKVICLRGQGAGFSTGLVAAELADLKAGSLEATPSLDDLCRTIENSPKPVVAALRGAVLEGGLALALAAHYRVCGPKARLGAPEITFGMVPGGGVTQRLPRLIGAAAALEMMLSGKSVAGQHAQLLGICDELVDMRDLRGVNAFCQALINDDLGVRRTCDVMTGLSDGAAYMDAVTKHRARAGQSHIKAFGYIVDCVEAALLLPFEAGVFRENAARLDALGSKQVRAMRHAYLAERRAARPAGLNLNQSRAVSTIGIAGVSNMALAIAMAALDHGFEVVVFGSDANQVALAQRKITRSYELSAQQGHITPEIRDKTLGRFSGASDLQSLSKCDLVIDATSGTIERRAQILSRIEEFIPQDAVLATINDHGFARMAQDLSHPERFLGLHFFAPAQATRVVEVVRTEGLSEVALATAHATVRKMGKVPVCLSAHDGLIANTLEKAAWDAVDVLLLMGVAPSRIDQAMTHFGMPVGPCANMDALGLAHFNGVAVSVLKEAGRTGRGGNGGFYDYVLTDQTPQRKDDHAALALIDALREGAGIDRVTLSDAQICDRIILAQANAGARLLQTGVAARPVDIDAVMLLGRGFPRWQGGPMLTADVMRPLVVQKKLREFTAEAPDIWEPAQMWADLIKNGDDLESLNLS